jgi:hypothetical protein
MQNYPSPFNYTVPQDMGQAQSMHLHKKGSHSKSNGFPGPGNYEIPGMGQKYVLK